MTRLFPRLAAAVLCLMIAQSLSAQTAQIAFGTTPHDSSQPVEVSSDSLTVDQTDGAAVFSGNVLVAQGDLRLSAGTIRVEYGADNQGIARLVASGGVTLVNGQEAAEAQEAAYSIEDGTVVLTGDVIVTQARTTLAGERMVINLTDGTGSIEGRVRTIFQTGDR